MGILTTSGSLARVIGPIGVSFVYQAFGTYFTFGGICTILTLALLAGVLSYKHLKVTIEKRYHCFSWNLSLYWKIGWKLTAYINDKSILLFQPPEDPKPLKEEESLLFKTKTTKVTFISSNQNGVEDRKHSDSEGWLDMLPYIYVWRKQLYYCQF